MLINIDQWHHLNINAISCHPNPNVSLGMAWWLIIPSFNTSLTLELTPIVTILGAKTSPDCHFSPLQVLQDSLNDTIKEKFYFPCILKVNALFDSRTSALPKSSKVPW